MAPPPSTVVSLVGVLFAFVSILVSIIVINIAVAAARGGVNEQINDFHDHGALLHYSWRAMQAARSFHAIQHWKRGVCENLDTSRLLSRIVELEDSLQIVENNERWLKIYLAFSWLFFLVFWLRQE